MQLNQAGMNDGLDTDRIAVSAVDETDPRRCVLALEDTAVIVLEQAFDDTLDADTDRVMMPRARTEPHWPPVPPLPQSRSRRHKAVYDAVTRPKTSSDRAS